LCAHNRFLLRSLEPLQVALGLLGESNLMDRTRALQNISDHEAIVRALEQRDGDAAELHLRNHIRAAYAARIQRFFTSSLPTA
jgi:DNA-binding GntR family transcriptional regulator